MPPLYRRVFYNWQVALLIEKVCGLVPVYNNPMTIGNVVEGLQQHIKNIIIADDGSNDETQAVINQLAAHNPEHIHVQRLPANRGKGAAVKVGLRRAQELGFSHALQVDADGQHDIGDVPKFLERMRATPDALILGAPVFGDDIPAIRKYGRKLTTLMIALEAGTLKLPDAMCGFRIYPVAPICALHTLCARMCFDPEIMIRAHWAGIPVQAVPTRVRYLSADEGGVSHFRSVHDNVLNVGLHTCLVLQAPLRWLQRYFKVRNT
jgi:glycosyltransferase involved in cell wall biosynthesis